MATTLELPALIVKADRVRASKALDRAHDAVERVTLAVSEDRDPADEARDVTYEHIAELSILIADLDITLRELEYMRGRLDKQCRYLVAAHVEGGGGDA